MKIAFFTEMGFQGKVPRTHDNMRTEFAWMVALDADHYNIHLFCDVISLIACKTKVLIIITFLVKVYLS